LTSAHVKKVKLKVKT